MWTPKNTNKISQNNILVFLLLEIVCVVFMVADHSAKITTPIRSGISVLTYPLVKVVELPQQVYQFVNTTISDQFSLINENVELKQKLSQAQIDLLQLGVISQQNDELRQLLNTKQLLPLKTTGAFIVNINTGKDKHHMIINQGHNQGVSVGQPVLDLNGVVGQVDKVMLENSHIILITNKNHVLPVEILRTGIRTFLYGTGELDKLSLPEIPQSADVQIGDVLITSGYGGIFPQGLKVATINTLVDSSDKSFQQAIAIPSANLALMKQLLLVWIDDKNSDVNEQKKQPIL